MNGKLFDRATAARAVPALVGGFVLANVASVSLALVLPLQRGDAVMAATLMSFCFYCAAIVWSFAARSAVRAWVGLGAWTVVLGLIALALIGVGA